MKLSVISARSRNVTSLGGDQVTLKRSLHMHTSITATPLTSHEVRTFGAGLSVACACISKEQRATLGLVGEDRAAFECYRMIGMNYIPLSAYERSGKGASNR